MIERCAIIGCGTLGSLLAIELSKTKKISSLKLIDFDCVSGEVYPFKDYEIYCPKVIVTKYICLMYNPDMEIETAQDKVTDNSDIGDYFILDCRDKKDKSINTNVRFSIDGPFLLIDSRKNYEVAGDHRYVLGRNEKAINESINYIINYLENGDYGNENIQIINFERRP